MRTRLSMLLAGMFALGVCSINAQQTQPKAKKTTEKSTGDAAHAHAEMMLPKVAVCVLKPSKDQHIEGTFMLTEKGDMTEIIGEVNGLAPGKHGFHIHEFGDLRSDDGMSAGGHYNPEGHPHGGPNSKEHHAGDLGNITADDSGKAMVNIKVNGLKVHFVVGRSLVVHAKEDDLKTQPSGDAGGRVAVGVIGIASDKPAGSTTIGPTSKGEKKTKS